MPARDNETIGTFIFFQDLMFSSNYEESHTNNSKNERNRQLLDAVEKNDVEMVKLLIKDTNVNVKFENEYGWTPLHIAVNKGNTEIIRLLIDTHRFNKNECGSSSP